MNYKYLLFPLLIGVVIFVIPLISAGTSMLWENWETGTFGQWSNSNWAIATDRQHTPSGTYSATCPQNTDCDMSSTVSMDTSSATSINISFWINDDDNEPSDTFWYINISDGTWEQRTNIDAASLGCADDTWCPFSVVVTGASYTHSGFAIRFQMGEDNGENYWIDDINVTMETAAGGSCTYGGSGNWEINCADACTFTGTTTIPTNNAVVNLTGTGTITFNSGGKWTFTGTGQSIYVGSGCSININSGGSING